MRSMKATLTNSGKRCPSGLPTGPPRSEKPILKVSARHRKLFCLFLHERRLETLEGYIESGSQPNSDAQHRLARPHPSPPLHSRASTRTAHLVVLATANRYLSDRRCSDSGGSRFGRLCVKGVYRLQTALRTLRYDNLEGSDQDSSI